MPAGRPNAPPIRKGASSRQRIARLGEQAIAVWLAILQTIMIWTIYMGSPARWNSMAPQTAEKANPAMLETADARRMAPMTTG